MDFFSLVKSADKEGKEKHVPTIELGSGHDGAHENIVRVTVGKEVSHPNTIEHHIVWVSLYGIKKETNQVIYLGREDFTPVYTEPTAKFKVRLHEFSEIVAFGYCNIHGVWINNLTL